MWVKSDTRLTSYCSQPGDDTWTGGWGGALAALSLPLVHTGRSLDCDLVLEAFMQVRKIKFIQGLMMPVAHNKN